MLVDAKVRFLQRASKQYTGPDSCKRFVGFTEGELRIVKLFAARAKIKKETK